MFITLNKLRKVGSYVCIKIFYKFFMYKRIFTTQNYKLNLIYLPNLLHHRNVYRHRWPQYFKKEKKTNNIIPSFLFGKMYL